eukprot:g40051.t1
MPAVISKGHQQKKRQNTTWEKKERSTSQPGNAGLLDGPGEAQSPAIGNHLVLTAPQLQATGGSGLLTDSELDPPGFIPPQRHRSREIPPEKNRMATSVQRLSNNSEMQESPNDKTVAETTAVPPGLGILLQGGNFITEVKVVVDGCLLVADVTFRNAPLRLINVYALTVKNERLAILYQLPLLAISRP